VLVYVEGTRVTRRPIALVIPLLARSSNAEKVLHALLNIIMLRRFCVLQNLTEAAFTIHGFLRK